MSVYRLVAYFNRKTQTKLTIEGEKLQPQNANTDNTEPDNDENKLYWEKEKKNANILATAFNSMTL